MARPKSSGEFTPSYWRQWSHAFPADPHFFPVAVWQQSPVRTRDGVPNAINYRKAGINTFAGLWDFPGDSGSSDAIAAVKDAGMYALAGGYEGETGDVTTMDAMSGRGAVAGFNLGDEQDMSTNPAHITPQQVAKWATALHKADPTRPIYNNWGKPFALYPWVGAHDDLAGMKLYCSQVDISSADYYAATDGYEPAGEHTPNYYGRMIDHIRKICGGAKPAWGFVETGHPFSGVSGDWPPYSHKGVITAATVEQAVWSMLAHGANGIVYFVHDFYSDGFTEDGLFDHPQTLATVTKVNATIHELAPILNAQRQASGLKAVHADATLRADSAGRYVIAAENSGKSRKATFTVAVAAGRTVEVVGEHRTLTADSHGSWSDSFTAWGHHVYKIT